MKKEVTNTLEVAVNNNEESAAMVAEFGATHMHLRTLIDEICSSDEFSILRETLRLYTEEITMH